MLYYSIFNAPKCNEWLQGKNILQFVLFFNGCARRKTVSLQAWIKLCK
jgi:hypothetical protein